MPSSAVPHIAIQAIGPLLDILRTRQIDPAAVFRDIGLVDVAASDPDARIPLTHLDWLWTHAAERLGDDNLGLHAAELVQPDSFGLLSYLGTASASCGEAFRRVFRYFRLLSDASGYQLAESDGVATITATQDTPLDAPVRQRVEFTISVLYCYARRVVDGDLQLLDVFFEHAPPADVSEHRRLYGRAPRFGTVNSGFSFASELLARPLRTRNPALASLLERLAARMLADLPCDTTVAAALRRLCIERGFADELTLAAAARRLHVSPRTLQRRLHSEGTSLHEVIDDARRELASRMLTQSGLAIAEVAFALGFSEPGALHRAFKRWTGMTPAAFRRAAVDHDASSVHAALSYARQRVAQR